MPIITIDHLTSVTRSDTDSDDGGEQWAFVPRKTSSVGQNSDGNGERSESNTNYRKPRVEEYAPSDDDDGEKWHDEDDDPEEIPIYHRGSRLRSRMGRDIAVVGEGALSNAADASSSPSADSSDEAPHTRRPRRHTVRFEEPERHVNPLAELETKLKHVEELLAEAKRAIIAKSENPKETHVDMDELFHRFCERVKWEEAKRAERLEREDRIIVQEAKMVQKAMLAEVEKEREFKAKVQACVVDLFGPQCLEWSSRGGPPPPAPSPPPPPQSPLSSPPRQAMEPVCTWLPKALICKEALKELGVDYFERDEYFLVDQRLDTTTQQELVDRTAVLKEYIKRFQDAPVVAGLNGTWCKHVKPPGCLYPLVIPVDKGVHGDWDDDEDRRSEFSGTTSFSDLSQLSWDATSITSNTSLGFASNEAVEDSRTIPLGCGDLIDLEMGCSEVGTLKIPSSREDLPVSSSRDDTGESASTDDAHENSPTEKSASAPPKETVPERKEPLRVCTHPRSVGRNEKRDLVEPKKHANSIGGETEPEHSIGTNSATSPCPKTPTPSPTATRAMRKAKRGRVRVRSVGSKKHAHDIRHEDPYAWPPGLPPLGLEVHLPSPKGWRERAMPPQESLPRADEAQLNNLLISAPPWVFNRLQQDIELTAMPSTSARGVVEEVPTFAVVDAIHPDESYQQSQLAGLTQPAAPRQDSQPMSSHQLVPDLADIQRWIKNTRGAAAFPVSNFTGLSGVSSSPAAAFTEGPAVSAQPHPSGLELGAQGYDTSQDFIAASVRDASRASLERDSSTTRSDQNPKAFDLPARQRSPSLQDFPRQERDIYSNIIEQLESLVQSLTAETSRMLEDELHFVRKKARKNRERERRERSARRNSHISGRSSSGFTSHSPPRGRDYGILRPSPPPRPAPTPGPSSYLSADAPSPAHYSSYNTAPNPTDLHAHPHSHPTTCDSSPLSSITSTEVSGGQNDQESSRAVAADDEDFVRRPILRTDSGITTSIAVSEAPGLRHRRSNGVASGGVGGGSGLADITRSNSAQSREQAEARSSGDPERGVEAPEAGPVWVEALSYHTEESVMIDTRSGFQVPLRPPKIPMHLLGPSPPPGYLPAGHQLDDPPSQISSHQSVVEERNFIHPRELDDGSRQSRFIRHPHHRGADSSSRRDYRSSSVRHGRHGNREQALVLWRSEYPHSRQSSYSPERRPHSSHGHKRRPRTPSSHSIRDTDYELPETVVFAAAPHSRLLEAPPTLPRQSPLPMVNYPPPVAFPPGIKAKVVDVYHQSPFKPVPRTIEVSPSTFFVSILLSTHSCGSEFRVFRIELDKSEVDDRVLFQTIKSTFHGLRGWRRRFSFKGVTDIKFAQYGQDGLPWHQNDDPQFRRLIVTPISRPIDYGAYAGNQLLRYFYSPKSLRRASSQWIEAFRELNGGKPVPKILDLHGRTLSKEVYAPPLDEPSGQGILFTEGWLPDRIIGAACSVVLLSFFVALTWSFLKDPEEGIAAGGYVLTALSSIIGMVSLVNALDTFGS